MITKEVIEKIYKQFGKRPKNTVPDLGLLFERAGILHDVMIDPDTNELTIGSIPEDSPFHAIKIDNITAILPFEEWVAIVMYASIIFLNVKKPMTSIHLRATKTSFWEKLSLKHVAL